MSVDAIQLANESDGELHHDPYLGLLPLSVLKEQIHSFNNLIMTASSFKSKHALVACYKNSQQSRRDPGVKQQLIYLIVLLTRRPTKPRSSHVSTANCLDLLHTAELWLGQQLSG